MSDSITNGQTPPAAEAPSLIVNAQYLRDLSFENPRAPESLMYLAQALVTLNKPAAQVCKVYTELQRSYGTKVEADPKMKAAVAKGRAASSCS